MDKFFNREKFRTELAARGISMTNDEMDRYIERFQLEQQPKSYLPYKNQMVGRMADTGYQPATLEDPLPEPMEQENAAWDFVGNLLWEAVDVGTFGGVGALDYNDYFENLITGGGPTTFAGRVGAGLGGLAGFIPPMGLAKGAIGMGVKGLSRYGTKAAGEKMVKNAASALNRTKYKNLSKTEQDAIWKPFMDTLNDYGHKLDNKAVRDTFVKSLDKNIRPTIREQLKKSGINPTTGTIDKIEDIVRTGMGIGEGYTMPVWNLQQRLAIMLGGSQQAGKIANLGSHALEEALVFAAVETPMELMNSIDEFRDPDIPGTLAHALTLGGALGFIRMIPGGADMPIFRTGLAKLTGRMNKTAGRFLDNDYSSPEARELLGKSVLAMWARDKSMFSNIMAQKLPGIDAITSASQIKNLVSTAEGAEKLARAMHQIEKNFLRNWWPDFMKQAGEDLYGSIPRMFAGSLAFNHEILFDEHVPLEDKVFNIAVGAWMTKRGRTLEYFDEAGKATTWKTTERPFVYNEDFKKSMEYLNILGAKPESLILERLIQEQELKGKFIGVDKTPDVETIFNTLEKQGVVVDSAERKRKPKNPANRADHELYDYLNAISSFYVHPNSGKRMREVDELTSKQITAIEKSLQKISLDSTKDNKGIFTVSDVEDVMIKANENRTNQVLELYKDVISDMYQVLDPAKLPIDRADMAVARLNITNIGELNQASKDAIYKMQAVRDLLERYGLIKVSKSRNPQVGHKIDTSKDNQNKIKETMDRLESSLHEIIFKGESVFPEDAPKIGDAFIAEVLNGNMLAKSVRDSYSRLRDLRNESNQWAKDKVTGLSDNLEVDNLIAKLFTDEASLGLNHKVIVTPGGKEIPADLGAMQQFADTILKILPATTKYTTPPGFGNVKPKNISYNDIKRLRQLFIQNGMGGFTFTGEDLNTYVNNFRGYVLDQKLSGATRNDGKPFTGQDRAKMNSLIQSGIINENLEAINIIRQIDTLNGMMANPEFMKKLMDFKLTNTAKGFVLDSELVKNMFDKTDVKTQEMLESMLGNILNISEAQNITPTALIKDLHGKYKEHLSPYILDPIKNKGFVKIRDVVAEADLLTMSDILLKLEMVDSQQMKLRHSELMETVDKIYHEGLSKESKDFLSTIRNSFWNRHADTAKIVAILSKYGHKDAEGKFNPVYDAFNKQFNLDFDKSKDVLNQALRDLEQYIPGNLRSELLDQKVRELMEDPFFASDVSHSVTPQSFIGKYHLADTKETLIDVLKNQSNPAEALKPEIAIKRDGETDLVRYENMKDAEKMQYVDDIVRLMLTSGETRGVKKLVVVDRAGVHADYDNTATDNPMFRFADELLGAPGKFSLVNRRVEMGYGTVDSRIDAKAFARMVNRLYEAKSTQEINSKSNAGESVIKTEQLEPHIFINIGDYGWGLAIPKSDAVDISSKFEKFIKNRKGKYSAAKYNKVFKTLKENYELKTEEVLDADGKVIGREYKYSDGMGDSIAVENMFTVMWLDKMLGKTWWDHLAETHGIGTKESSAAIGKFSKRLRLMANISHKELSDTHVNRTISIHSKNNLIPKKELSDMKTLQKNKGINAVIIADEGSNSKLFSTLQGVLEQINKENSAGKLDPKDRDTIIGSNFGDSKITTTDGGTRGDASIADSVMLMSPRWFKALQTIAGYNSLGQIGGIKPIISSTGDALLLGKTAILPDSRFEGFFKSNPNTHAIIMDSAAKMKNPNITPINVENIDMKTLKGMAIKESDHIVNIPWKDVNIGAPVQAEHKGTVSYQMANELDANLSSSFYDWIIAPNIERLNEAAAPNRFLDVQNSMGGVAFARRITDAGTGDNMSMSVMNYWLNTSNGGSPIHFTGVLPAFKNSFKSKFIDNGLLQLHTEHGSQSVMSPFLGQNYQDLRNTTFTVKNGVRELYTYGQAEIAGANRNKKVPIERLNLIKHNAGERDNLISYKQLMNRPKMKQAIENVLNIKSLPDNTPLHKVYDVITEFNKLNKSNYEIALVFHRTPSTRPSDKIIVGLKGFIKNKDGNQARLNAYDAFARAEADFDIDKINYWWDTPSDVLAKWNKNSGKVGIVSEEPMDTRHSLDNKYDWLDANSMRKLSGDVAHAEKMRGQVVKAQRLVQFLSEYNSNTQDKGLVINLKKYGERAMDNDQRIVFDHDRMDINRQLLAEDIQRIIDSHNGYNNKLYASESEISGGWINRFLFGDAGARYDGLFKRQVYDKKNKKWEDIDPSKTESNLSEAEQHIVKELLQPYRSLLQYGSNLYESGQPRSVRYDDLLTGIQSYNNAMNGLNKRIYQRLLRKLPFDSDARNQIKTIFEKPGTKYELNNVIGDFGLNASTVESGKLKNPQKKLPFERMMAATAFRDRLTQDSPKQLFGQDLARFENFYEQLLHADGDGVARQEVFNKLANDLRKDSKSLRFINYLRYKENKQRAAHRNALKDGHVNMAEAIMNDIASINAERIELEKSLSLNEDVIRYVQGAAGKRIISEILNNPKFNKHRQFSNQLEAKKWINQNPKAIAKLASLQPVKYRAINDAEYRDVFIFGEILGKYRDIFVDPSINAGQSAMEFQNAVYEFKNNYKKMWSNFFADKNRKDKFEPWYNETRIMNTQMNELTHQYRKWNEFQPGLGELFLWKVMAPTPKLGEFTVFNGKLSQAYSERDMSYIKLGLRFIAGADEMDMGKFKKKMFFDLIGSQYTDWFDFLHNNKVDGKDGLTYRQMYDTSLRELYENPAPFIDFKQNRSDASSNEKTMQYDLNPIMQSIFGVDNSYTYGFLRDPSAAASMKESAQHHVMPRGYIPIHYRGGEHPKISGWSDWNNARRGEGYLMLGEALNKNVLTFRETPVIKNVFNEVSNKRESTLDLKQRIREKALHEDSSTGDGC